MFLLVGSLCLPPHHRNEAFCDWVISDSTRVYLRKDKTTSDFSLTSVLERATDRVFVCAGLTLSASAADLSKHRSLTQPVKSLLADQLQQLWLQALFELTVEEKQHTHN